MTIPSSMSTSNSLPGVSGLAAPDGVPAGLPDEVTLARLAGEFFAALPGGFQVVPSAPPAGLPVSPRSSSQVAQTAFSPETPQLSAPGRSPELTAADQAEAPPSVRPSGNALGVPEAYAAALPQSNVPGPAGLGGFGGSPTASAPTSPFYFLAESSNHTGSSDNPGKLAAAPEENRITPQSYGLPGELELASLLGGLDSHDRGPAKGQSANSPGFYFTDLVVPRDGGQVPAVPGSAHPPFDVNAIRRDFPILSERIHGGKQLVWFDNAATTQKPQAVIDRLAYFYAHENSNIHRAAHALAARATDAYEAARNKVAAFLGAGSSDAIVFVRGATEAINLVAKAWGDQNIGEGDEIVVSLLEHHANIVPWQQLAARKGAKIRVIPVDDSGQILLDEARRVITGKTKLVAITQVSNALGTVTPVKEIVELGHRVGAKVLVDGAQSVSHMRVNVQALDADFFVFSGHKVFGPTGIGALYGKPEILEAMQPWQGGGNMIADVTFEKTQYQPAPAKFEAGTGNIADAVGLGAAIDYVQKVGLENIARYEHDLLAYATAGLLTVPGLHLVGTARDKASVASFVLDGYRTEEVGAALDKEGITVRSGHHCAQPILRRFGLEATVRPSLAFYNTCQEVDLMIATLHKLARGQGSVRSR